MPSLKAVVVEELKEEDFGVKVADEGVIAYLSSRKPSRHEIMDTVPELEGCPMDTVENGVFIQVGEKPFAI
jgi:hypothetical protein